MKPLSTVYKPATWDHAVPDGSRIASPDVSIVSIDEIGGIENAFDQDLWYRAHGRLFTGAMRMKALIALDRFVRATGVTRLSPKEGTFDVSASCSMNVAVESRWVTREGLREMPEYESYPAVFADGTLALVVIVPAGEKVRVLHALELYYPGLAAAALPESMNFRAMVSGTDEGLVLAWWAPYHRDTRVMESALFSEVNRERIARERA